MEVAEDNEGYAYFNDVLYVALRRSFGYKLDGQAEGPPGAELITVPKKSISLLHRDEITIREELRTLRFWVFFFFKIKLIFPKIKHK